MKKSIIFLLLLSALNVFAQRLPDQKYINYKGSSIHLQDSPDFQYPKNSFALGWHWANGKYTTGALDMNYIHTEIQESAGDPNYNNYNIVNQYYKPNYFADSCRMIMRSTWIGGNWGGWNPKDARALHYIPTLQENEMTDTTMDLTNGFLGFRFIDNSATISGTSLLLDSATTINGIVLSDNLLADRMEYQFLEDTINCNSIFFNDNIFPTDLNSEILYFSINLRRTDVADNLQDTTVVLRIRLPYRNLPDQQGQRIADFVKFDSIPSAVANDTILLPNNRGIIGRMTGGNGATELIIRKSMLPRGNATDKDITLVGQMLFNTNINNPNNYYFKGHNTNDSLLGHEIDSLKIEVEYTKRSSLGINWIRIETRPAMEMYQGKWDSLIITKIQRDVDSTTAPNSIFVSKGLTPFRWYLKDEYPAEYWATNRYFYKLIGPVFTVERGPDFPRLYRAYFGVDYLWYSMFSYVSAHTVPYINRGVESEISNTPTYYSTGWEGRYFNNLYKSYNEYDNAGSSSLDIAPYIPKGGALKNDEILTINQINCSISDYESCCIDSFQASPTIVLEKSLYNAFYRQNKWHFLFDTIPWWGQYFQLGDLHIGDNCFYYVDYRPKTGEEIRNWIDHLIILGAKGIMIDGEETRRDGIRMAYYAGYIQDSVGMTLTQARQNNWSNYLYNHEVGSDFLEDNPHINWSVPHYNPNYINYYSLQQYYNLDTIAQYTKVDRNRVYIGQMSTRTEVKKQYDLIRANEQTLLNLKLKAWLGKGIHLWYIQDPNQITQNLFSKYIDINNICTRPIGRDTLYKSCSSCHVKPYYEQHYWTKLTVDSGFYDITLLAHTSDTNMSSTVYLGISNRRNDPLVYISKQDSIDYNLPSYYHMGYNFIPTAEFDSLVNFGNKYTDPQKENIRQFYNTLWWKRLGAREINIPFNKQPSKIVYYYDPSFQYHQQRILGFMINYAVKVRELGYDMPDWYMQRPYNDKIWDASRYDKMKSLYFNPDTVNLVMKLLPGQGKILQVEYEYAFPVPPWDIGLFSTYCNQIEYLKPAVQYKGTICDSLINTRLLLSKGIAISLDVPVDMKYTHLPDNTQQARGISLPPCTSDDATEMTSNTPKIVARWENINGISTMRYYTVWNGICYCEHSNFGGIYIGSGTLVRNVPCDSIHEGISSSEMVMDSANRIVQTYSTLGFPTRDPSYIGTTTINASALRNYIAWSDAELGIGIGWMYPGDSLIRGTTYIPNVQMPGGESFTTLVNPEMNRYSRVDLGEDECALVFEGKKSATLDDSTNQLFYTRIKVDSLGNVVPFLPVISCDMAYLMQKDITGRISMISYGTTGTRHRNARIIRNVAQYQMPNLIDPLPGSLAIKMDRVIWEATDELGNSIVEYSGYDYRDTMSIGQSGIEWKPYCYSAKIPTVIKAINGDVKSPSLAQGVMKDQMVIMGLDTEIVKTYYNDSAMVMAFGVNDSLIYQIPQNFWTLTTGGELSLDVIPNINELSDRGKEPVLPELMSVKDDSLYKYMRIFYTSDSSESKQSGQYFYKGINFNDKYNYLIGFSNKGRESKWFSPITLLDTNGIQSPKISMYNQSGGQYIPNDTISTEWFKIGQIKGLNYLEQGNMISGYSMNIERQRDGKIWEITENKVDSKSYKFHQKVFINGQNEKYRIFWIKQAGVKQIEQLLIGNLPERMLLNMDSDEELQKTSNVNEQIVDLNGESYATNENKLQILAYPNPAKEEIYVVCYLPQNEVIQGNNSGKMNIKLYNSMGQEVYSKEITAGQLVRIQTSNLENGAYFVKATLNDNNTTIPTATKSIIIQK